MTNARKFAFATMVAAVAVLGACRDERPDKGTPTAPKLVSGASANTLGGCTTPFKLDSLASLVFGSGSPNVNAVIGKIDNLRKKVETGNLVDAQAQANNIVDFVKAKAADGRLAGTQAQIAAFISGVLCYGGLSPDTFLIQPTDQPQIIASTEGTSGVSLQGNTVDVPTLLTLTTLSPTGPSPLITKLDQYPSYVSITTSSTLTKSAIVSVCPTGNIPAAVLARLRLGHQAAAGFELTPPADGSFLPCGTPASLASTSLLPGWLRTVASIFIPKPLYAMLREEADRGVGGLATEFSPFGAVDPELEFDRGGVGGLATEFKKTGTTPPAIGPVAKAPVNSGSATAAAPTLSNPGVSTAPGVGPAFDVVDPCLTATVNTEVTAGCRPSVIIRTHNGTTMQGVQVDWAIDLGGGKIAALDALVCGTLDKTSFSTITDADGKTGSCWQVGPNGGTNTVKAIPKAGTAGSDAPLGVRFFADPTKTGLIFTVEGLKIVTSITLSALSQPYDGSPKSVTATTSPAGISGVSITYDGASVQPTAAGSYAVVATLSNSQYQAPDATGTFTITKAPATVTLSNLTQTYTGGELTPTATTVPAGLAIVWTNAPQTNAGTYAVTATINDANYTGNAPGSFVINKAPATLTLGNLGQTYTGSALTPTATTVPAGLAIVWTNAPQTNAGTYAVTATINDANYTGSASESFVINKAPATVTLSNLTQTYTGSALTPTATTVPTGLAIVWTNAPQTNAGTYAVTATINDANYTGNAPGSFAINKAPATVSVNGFSGPYDGNAHGATGTATGLGGVNLSELLSLGASFTDYPGGTASWTFVGNDNYSASSGTAAITIAKAPVTAAAGSYTGVYDGAVHGVSACTVSGAYTGGLPCTNSPASATTVAHSGPVTPQLSPGANFNVTYVSGAISITQAEATAKSGNASINFGAAVPTIPCGVTGLFGVDAGSVTCTTIPPVITVAGTYPTIPAISPASPVNYHVQKVNGTLTVAGYVQVGCFSSPIYNVMPETKSAQRKGSNLPVKCTLTTPQGAAVTTAKGDLVVVDRGNDGAAAPATVFSGTNVFKYSSGGNYSYGLDTSPIGFIAGHYYYVTATWSDGSTSVGWFLLK